MTDLRALAITGTELAIRVTPRASRNAMETHGPALRVKVTAVPEGGKANAAVTKLLAKALGLPTSRIALIRGETARDKAFRILPP
ncbi:MAG: DUF167 domain-containing protein [Paracoccaceae bacterium]|nr:DUF167 domain-containing protein [Paracoccaceae bacterium]